LCLSCLNSASWPNTCQLHFSSLEPCLQYDRQRPDRSRLCSCRILNVSGEDAVLAWSPSTGSGCRREMWLRAAMAVPAPDRRLVVCPTSKLKNKEIDSRCMPFACRWTMSISLLIRWYRPSSKYTDCCNISICFFENACSRNPLDDSGTMFATAHRSSVAQISLPPIRSSAKSLGGTKLLHCHNNASIIAGSCS
jgi:hypothetical protein